jgi:hypothetical protein
MTRRSPPWLPTPRELAGTPSLAIVAALDPMLDVLVVALTAAHEELQATADGRDVVTSSVALAADEVIVAIQALSQATCTYRLALLNHLAVPRR